MSKKKSVPPYEKSENITEVAFDSHAHLSYFEDYQSIIDEFENNGVKGVCNIVTSFDYIKTAEEISARNKNIFFMVGLHPYDIDNFNNEFEEMLFKLKESNSSFVGVGEIGLDYHQEYWETKEKQKEIFLKQIILADKLNLPISVHIRDAHSDAIELLKANKQYLKNSGIIHCFSGSREEVQEYLKLGLYISFSGAITYKKASEETTELQEALKIVPIDKLLIETDCPYLTPVPYRGKENSPKYVFLTAQKIADLRQIDVNEVLKQTTKNFYKLIKKPC